MSLPEALELVEKLEKESKTIKEELFRICWYMRGSVSIDNAFGLCSEDRTIISKIINENIEITKETKLPFF